MSLSARPTTTRRRPILLGAVALATGMLAAGTTAAVTAAGASASAGRTSEIAYAKIEKKKGKPKPAMEQKVVQLLRSDPQMRAAFIDKVAAPIANKMFECGMIP